MSTFHGTCHKCGKTGHSKKFCNHGNQVTHGSHGMKACYDCGAQVPNIDAHRASCPNSRLAHSSIHSANVAPVQKQVIAGTTDWYAILDVSGSMAGDRLNNAKAAVLTDIAPVMQEDDRMAIVTFDSQAFFKLKPRAVGQLRRQNELGPLLDRIFAQGSTALWDAIHLAISQIHDKNRRTVMTVLTDGEDNSSKHTYADVLALVDANPNVHLSIVHVGSSKIKTYDELAQRARGTYHLILETEIRVTFTATFRLAYVPTVPATPAAPAGPATPAAPTTPSAPSTPSASAVTAGIAGLTLSPVQVSALMSTLGVAQFQAIMGIVPPGPVDITPTTSTVGTMATTTTNSS